MLHSVGCAVEPSYTWPRSLFSLSLSKAEKITAGHVGYSGTTVGMKLSSQLYVTVETGLSKAPMGANHGYTCLLICSLCDEGRVQRGPTFSSVDIVHCGQTN